MNRNVSGEAYKECIQNFGGAGTPRKAFSCKTEMKVDLRKQDVRMAQDLIHCLALVLAMRN
jgi:hypothetical protein